MASHPAAVRAADAIDNHLRLYDYYHDDSEPHAALITREYVPLERAARLAEDMMREEGYLIAADNLATALKEVCG